MRNDGVHINHQAEVAGWLEGQALSVGNLDRDINKTIHLHVRFISENNNEGRLKIFVSKLRTVQIWGECHRWRSIRRLGAICWKPGSWYQWHHRRHGGKTRHLGEILSSATSRHRWHQDIGDIWTSVTSRQNQLKRWRRIKMRHRRLVRSHVMSVTK